MRTHEVSRPRPGWVEMGADEWWEEFSSIAKELTSCTDADIRAVGVSGMGPCALLTDNGGTPLRPAILYGVDTRATAEIEALSQQLGAAAILERSGSALSTQAVGPKLAWIAVNEPDVMERASRLFMPSSWLVWKLSGQYVLDHHSASQCTPLYDTVDNSWYRPWAELIAPNIELPPLLWANEIAGIVSLEAAAATGLPEGIPVIAGTIDAWTEAVSVGAQNPGDLMLMYGTTMFLVATTEEKVTVPNLWSTVGVYPGTRNIAGGMATSGAITGWLRGLFGAPDFAELLSAAAARVPAPVAC
ncbi:glycerol kinase 2 [Arthrobacter sp. Hiyo6]|nr:glycerol kinase 2 [Arthrobacter sp. Hiyo6]